MGNSKTASAATFYAIHSHRFLNFFQDFLFSIFKFTFQIILREILKIPPRKYQVKFDSCECRKASKMEWNGTKLEWIIVGTEVHVDNINELQESITLQKNYHD